jgi:hypothetical protein
MMKFKGSFFVLISACLMCCCARTAKCDEYDRWRWWLLGASDDSVTIKLFDTIWYKYLYESDLRVLREDLEAHYIKLSDGIGSLSEAQTGALLIRLFHYSAARPSQTGIMVQRIATELSAYLNSSDHNSNSPVILVTEMWTAVDLGQNVVIDRKTYNSARTTFDYNRMTDVLRARYMLEGVSLEDRAKQFLQSVDGVSKHLEYNNICDVTFASNIVSTLYHYLDSIRTSALNNIDIQNDEVDSRWLLAYRQLLLLSTRLYRNMTRSAFSERQVTMFSLLTNVAGKHCPVSFPEIRMRSSALQYLVERPYSRRHIADLSNGVDSNMLAVALMIELSDAGVGSYVFDTQILSKLTTAQPIRMGWMDSAVLETVDGIVEKQSNSYCENFRQQFPAYMDIATSHNQPADKDAVAYAFNITLDKYFLIRKAMFLLTTGDKLGAKSTIWEAINEVHDSLTSHYVVWKSVQWALNSSAKLEWSASEQSRLLHYAIRTSLSMSDELVNESLPWLTTAAISKYRQSALESLHRLMISGQITSLRQDSADVMPYIMQRGMVTRSMANLPVLSCDSITQNLPPQIGSVYQGCYGLLRILQQSSLGKYISFNSEIDRDLLLEIENITDYLNLVYSQSRSTLISNTYGKMSEWSPCSGSAYMMIERYAESTDAKWVVVLLTTDTIIYSRPLSDSEVIESVLNKRRSLQYGVVSTTLLDSVITSMVFECSEQIGSELNRLVFLPSGVLNSFNPYIVKWGDVMLADSLDIVVACGLASNLSQECKSSYKLCVLRPRNIDLTDVEEEVKALRLLAQENEWDLDVLDEVDSEDSLRKSLADVNALHIASHASQSNALIERIAMDNRYVELMSSDAVGTVAKRLWSPLIQYSSKTRDTGALYGDGYISPIEMSVYGVRLPSLVYLSTCQTATLTSDLWEPPDGVVREFFTLGAQCVVSSPIPVPDLYATSYAANFYLQLAKSGEPCKAAGDVVRSRRRESANALSIGAYYPIYLFTH